MKIQMKSPLSHRHTWHRPSPRWSCYLWVPSCANLWPRRSVPGWKIPMFGPFVTWRWSKTPNTSSIFFSKYLSEKRIYTSFTWQIYPKFCAGYWALPTHAGGSAVVWMCVLVPVLWIGVGGTSARASVCSERREPSGNDAMESWGFL